MKEILDTAANFVLKTLAYRSTFSLFCARDSTAIPFIPGIQRYV
jgi:hypothetical protein